MSACLKTKTMETGISVVMCVLCLTTTVKSDVCDVIKISDSWNMDVSGEYYELAKECTHERDSYRKGTTGPHLYHTADWWIVSDNLCHPDGINNGYIRISSKVYDPEYINGVWEERNGTIWTQNPAIKLTCSGYHDHPYDDDDDDLDDDDIWMIVGITTAVIVAVIAIVLAVIYCPRKQKAVKPEQATAQGAPASQSMSAYYPGAGNSVTFVPPQMPGSMPGSMPMGVQNTMTPNNPWIATQMPMAQVPLPSYNQAMSTEKTDSTNIHQNSQMTYGVPGGGKIYG